MRFLKSRLENTILEIGFMKYDFRNQVYLVDLDRMPTAWGFEKKPPKLSERCKKKFMWPAKNSFCKYLAFITEWLELINYLIWMQINREYVVAWSDCVNQGNCLLGVMGSFSFLLSYHSMLMVGLMNMYRNWKERIHAGHLNINWCMLKDLDKSSCAHLCKRIFWTGMLLSHQFARQLCGILIL